THMTQKYYKNYIFDQTYEYFALGDVISSELLLGFETLMVKIFKILRYIGRWNLHGFDNPELVTAIISVMLAAGKQFQYPHEQIIQVIITGNHAITIVSFFGGGGGGRNNSKCHQEIIGNDNKRGLGGGGGGGGGATEYLYKLRIYNNNKVQNKGLALSPLEADMIQ
ncbi:hypothetical protein ACJX0J_029214, partial [Zea mays]